MVRPEEPTSQGANLYRGRATEIAQLLRQQAEHRSRQLTIQLHRHSGPYAENEYSIRDVQADALADLAEMFAAHLSSAP